MSKVTFTMRISKKNKETLDTVSEELGKTKTQIVEEYIASLRDIRVLKAVENDAGMADKIARILEVIK